MKPKNRPDARTVTHAGLTLTLTQWAARTGINAETIRSRLDHQGWSPERALTTRTQTKFAKRGADPIPPPRPCPKMLRHTATNRAYARWSTSGRESVRYFGPWGSKEAAAAYRRFAVEWAAAGELRGGGATATHVCELVAAYLEHVARYYVRDGKPTSEQHNQRSGLRVLLELYPDLPVAEFKPRHLKACQQAMVAKGWVRTTVNRHTWTITKCFSWGVAEELVAAEVADALAHVPNLQAGRTAAPDAPPVMSVPAERIAAALPHLDPDPARRAVLEALVRVHELTGCRPGELCAMTAGAIDTAGDVWCYRVTDKNTHRQAKRRPRVVWIGPRAQALLKPFLDAPGPGGRVWCLPARYPDGPRAKPVPISAGRYAEFVRVACGRAKVEPWTPHQLRHNRATEVQRLYESDGAAAAVIGDTPEVTRAVYADPNEAVAKRIALATG